VYDADGTKVLEILRPAILKSSIQIRDAGGASRGAIDQEKVVGKKRFALRGPGGEALGSIDADNWRSWDCAVHDARGAEIARVTKEWAGFLREGLTTADHYVLEISGPTSPDLRFLLSHRQRRSTLRSSRTTLEGGASEASILGPDS
jgi:hypothetical protein